MKKLLAFGIRIIRDGQRRPVCDRLMMYSKLMVEYKFNDACDSDDMLNEQNNAWMPELSSRLSRSSCFIMVGSVHLNYKCGLISQLRDKGFMVTAINPI